MEDSMYDQAYATADEDERADAMARVRAGFAFASQREPGAGAALVAALILDGEEALNISDGGRCPAATMLGAGSFSRAWDRHPELGGASARAMGFQRPDPIKDGSPLERLRFEWVPRGEIIWPGWIVTGAWRALARELLDATEPATVAHGTAGPTVS